jgi:NAD(P)-dependent dehydrogenase (short-subunit alcohol dehydrogenase family)
VVAGSDDPFSRALMARLSALELPARFCPLAVSRDSARLPEVPAEAAGLILVAPGAALSGHPPSPADDARFLGACFRLVRQAGPNLLRRARQGRALLATVTRLEGAFGFNQQPVARPVLGGLAGLVKTAALEWSGVRCRAVDLAPGAVQDHPDRMAARTLDELLDGPADGPVEIGFDADRRWTLVPATPPPIGPRDAVDLGSGAVVFTGGGRGVTAEAAVALAASRPVKVALWGRSAPPETEPSWLAELTEAADIKRAIMENQFGADATPRRIEAAYRRWAANREVARTLDRLRERGAEAWYQSVDVRDPAAVTAAAEAVRSRFGAVAGIVHGAGAIIDRLIVDKTDAQFDQVCDTKIMGLFNLLEATADDPLRAIVLFSSVAARYGNAGQSDYAMANEALNKIARSLQRQRPDCKVLSINWGPWDGGMVTASLKRAFNRRGIELIPPAAGGRAMVAELARPADPAQVEVLLGAPLQDGLAPETAAPCPDDTADAAPHQSRPDPPPLFETARRELDLVRYPVLGDHLLNGVPVVPLALITEWLSHGALHDYPGMTLSGLRDLRLLEGIQLDESPKRIRLLAGQSSRSGASLEVPVEIRNGKRPDGSDLIHSRARAILGEGYGQAPDIPKPDPKTLMAYDKPLDEIYDRILFHGEALRGISRIIGMSERVMMAEVASAPAPKRWMTEPLRSDWITDPLVLHCAFQMASLWCYEQRGLPSLPSYSAAYHQYRSRFPQSGVTAVMTVTHADQHMVQGDFTFYDAEDEVIARMTGFQSVLEPDPNDAVGVNRPDPPAARGGDGEPAAIPGAG